MPVAPPVLQIPGKIRILNSQGQVRPFNLDAYTEGSTEQLVPAIGPGDVVFVPEKPESLEDTWLKIPPNRAVQIIGAVNQPGRYQWSDEMSLLDLLGHAGGPTQRADLSDIRIHFVDETVASEQEAEAGYTVYFDLASYLADGSVGGLPTMSSGNTVVVPELPVDPKDNKSMWTQQESHRSIYIMGASGLAGALMLFNENFNFLDILAAAGGPTANADIHQVRISHRDQPGARVTRLNLADYFEHGDPSLLPVVRPEGRDLYP